eukprot:scaffold248861_cov79-Cyclotella_meneghiniana.AAC.3
MSFLLNLFSPRKPVETPETNIATSQDDEMDDPLSKFFDADAENCSTEGGVTAEDEERAMSYANWKESRKQLLMNYVKYRLEGVANENEGKNGSKVGEDLDECSFWSEVLDEDFIDEKNASEENDNGQVEAETQDVHEGMPETQDGQHPRSESKSEASQGQSDEEMLETQPQTQLPTPRFPKTPNSTQSTGKTDKSGKSSINTAELVNRQVKRGFISGIKRKLGFGVETQESSSVAKTPNSSSTPNSTAAKDTSNSHPRKRRRLTNTKDGSIKGRRGLVAAAIPHVSVTSDCTNKLSEVDLYTKKLDLDLCQVLKVWRLRSCKRMAGSEFDTQDSSEKSSIKTQSARMNSYEHFQDDGPLNTIYKRVLSLEVAQLDIHTDSTILSSPRVSNLASAAFQSGQAQLTKVAERRGRHTVKRIRIFFYNKYADAVSRLLDEVSKNDKKKSTKFLMSLRNIPAHCIVPLEMAEMDPQLQHYTNNPFGDEEYGSRSSYCICIGDKCPLQLDGAKLHFDDPEIELRLLETPKDRDAAIDADAIDAIVNKVTIGAGGEGYDWDGRRTVLITRYLSHKGWGGEQQQQQQRHGMTILVGDEDTAVAPNETSKPDNNNASQDSSAGEGTHSGETANVANVANSDTIIRKSPVRPLSDMLPLLLENGKNRLKDMSVCGIVLGFSPPSL